MCARMWLSCDVSSYETKNWEHNPQILISVAVHNPCGTFIRSPRWQSQVAITRCGKISVQTRTAKTGMTLLSCLCPRFWGIAHTHTHVSIEETESSVNCQGLSTHVCTSPQTVRVTRYWEVGLINKLWQKGKIDLGQWNWDEFSFVIYTQLALGRKRVAVYWYAVM